MTPAQQVADFNARVMIGDLVYVGPTGLPRTTRAAAQVLSDGRAVVWLDGFMGAMDLDKIRSA